MHRLQVHILWSNQGKKLSNALMKQCSHKSMRTSSSTSYMYRVNKKSPSLAHKKVLSKAHGGCFAKYYMLMQPYPCVTEV